MKKIIRIVKYNYPTAKVRIITDKCNCSINLNLSALRRLKEKGNWQIVF